MLKRFMENISTLKVVKENRKQKDISRFHYLTSFIRTLRDFKGFEIWKDSLYNLKNFGHVTPHNFSNYYYFFLVFK